MMLVQQQLTVSGCERRRKPRSAISPYASPWSAAALCHTAWPFARECTSGPINVMTVPTSTMRETTALTAGRLRAAVLGHASSPHLSILTCDGKHCEAYAAPAVLSVTRAGLDRTSTRNVGAHRRHDARAAAAQGTSCERRRKARSAISPYASPWSASALWLTARPFARECTS